MLDTVTMSQTGQPETFKIERGRHFIEYSHEAGILNVSLKLIIFVDLLYGYGALDFVRKLVETLGQFGKHFPFCVARCEIANQLVFSRLLAELFPGLPDSPSWHAPHRSRSLPQSISRFRCTDGVHIEFASPP